jgi:hypothetical protein
MGWKIGDSIAMRDASAIPWDEGQGKSPDQASLCFPRLNWVFVPIEANHGMLHALSNTRIKFALAVAAGAPRRMGEGWGLRSGMTCVRAQPLYSADGT